MNNGIDLLDILLDHDNKDPIRLMDEKGREVTFEQVAIIPFDVDEERRLYVVLKPIDHIPGIKDDEAVVFQIDLDQNGKTILKVEPDETIAIQVFLKYYDLLEEARSKKIKEE